jgi:hypothetical protein
MPDGGLVFFVHYNDNYDEEGLEECPTEGAAMKFIEERLKMPHCFDGSLDDKYTVIEGRVIRIEAAETAVRVRLKR